MIINIRGTSGAGKSTLMRKIMALYSSKSRIMIEGRKQPIGYVLNGAGLKPIFIVGHYETACGGCDTISGYEKTFEMIRRAHNDGMNVIFEGLLLSGDKKFTSTLQQDFPGQLKIFAIDTPLEVCVESINTRRREKKGEDAPGVDPKNTEAKYKTLVKLMDWFKAQGYDAKWTSREETFEQVKELLQA